MIMNTELKFTIHAIVTFIVAMAFIIMPLASAHAVNLRSHNVIEDNVITLGDLFEGLSHNQDRVLGTAPLPGRDMVLNARTLLRIAMATDTPWRPASAADFITLSRAATIIDSNTIKDALTQSLKSEGLTGRYTLQLSDSSNIVLPADAPATLDIQDMRVRRDTNIFEATIVAPSAENPLHRSRISGKISYLSMVPVLKSSLRTGTIIGKHDIEMIEIPRDQMRQDMVISANDLIGQTPRHMITAGEIIKINQVQSPKIVERGEFVTMVFNKGPLKLTARGKALEHGTKGDVIRVVNTASNKTLTGIVTADKEIQVETF